MAQAKTKRITKRTLEARENARHAEIYRRYVEAAKAAHELKVHRLDREAELKAARHEDRWGGLRSIGLLVAIAIPMVGLLIVGAMAG